VRALARILTRRLLQAVLVALLVGTVCALMVRFLPGDIAYQIAGGRFGEDMTTEQAAAAVRATLGLDRPAWQAWLFWIRDLSTLDLGRSYSLDRPVWHLVRDQLGHTVLLSVLALGLSALLGPPLGVIAGLRPGGLIDRASLAGSVALRAMPPFVIGVVLVTLFAVHLQWLPAAGHTERGAIVLPAITLALGLAAVSSRVARAATVDVAGSDYVEFSLTKGLPYGRVMLTHGVRNIAVPVIAYFGVQLVYLVEGVVIVETLFAWPGIGHALTHAVKERDIPMVQGSVLTMALLFVLVSALVDMAVALVDPRTRDR
jgi:peptide/nickel transport system permease protein